MSPAPQGNHQHHKIEWPNQKVIKYKVELWMIKKSNPFLSFVKQVKNTIGRTMQNYADG